MHGMVVPSLSQPAFSTRTSSAPTSRPSSPFALKSGPRGHHRYATSTTSLSSSFDSDATLCASPDTLYQVTPWSDKAQRRSTSGSSVGDAAPEQHLRKFAYRQCALLRERYPTCHIIALPRGARPPSLQVFGCRDQDGERREDGEVESYQTILYCGQVEEVVMDFLVFDSGRLGVEAEMYAFASSSRERFGKYLFFDQIAPI